MTTTSSPTPSPENVSDDAAGEVNHKDITTTGGTMTGGITTEPAADQGAAALTPRQTTQAISGLMMGMLVAVLAGTVVSTALPRIIADLEASQSVYTWVVTVELLAMTGNARPKSASSCTRAVARRDLPSVHGGPTSPDLSTM